MSKKFVIAALFLGLFAIIFFMILRPDVPSDSTNSAITSIPSTSLEENICERVTVQFGDCKKILLFDRNSNLVFAESTSGIIPVLTNKEFTEFKKFMPIMDFQEFKEEKAERGPINWRAANHVQKKFSIIYGFAEDDAKTIVINSEGHIQPNKFFVRDNLWVWYVTFPKDKVTLPVKVTVYNADGQMIYGGNETE